MSQQISVTLYCQTCGNSHYDYNEDKTYVKCKVCDREYLGGLDELAEHNQQNIQSAVNDLGKDLIDDFAKKLESKFKNNKFIKFKRK